MDLVWRTTRKAIEALRERLRLHHNQKQLKEVQVHEEIKRNLQKDKSPLPFYLFFILFHFLSISHSGFTIFDQDQPLVVPIPFQTN